jgi:polyvinyl alcohol dehydrogenase (cytochrome)
MGGQNLHNWRNQDDTAISPKNAAKLQLKWTFTAGGDISATPAVAHGTVYFPDFKGNFYALDSDTGAIKWKQLVGTWTGVSGDYARNDPAIYNGMVILGNQAGNNALYTGGSGLPFGYFGGGGAKVVAVDAHTGGLKWSSEVESFPTAMVTSSPIVHNGVVYVGIASAEENTAATLATPCCISRGSVVALDVNTGRLLWKTYMVPDNKGKTGGYSGGGIWDSTPVIDRKRNLLYVGTGNNYSVPISVEQCFANNKTPSCTDPEDFFDSVVALDLDTGKIKWAHRALSYDAWNVNCIETITPPPNFSIAFMPGPNCPVPSGPDYDFGGSGPNLFPLNANKGDDDHHLLGIGEKSGIYWALDPDDGKVVWSTQVGPGSSLGGIEWGTATDGERIYVPVSNLNGIQYQLQPSGTWVNGGSWAALDPKTGKFLWQTGTPGACTAPLANVAQGCMGLGPASVGNGVVFVGSMDTNSANPTMFALDAATGHILWSYVAGSSVIAGPAIDEDSIYWGSGYGHFGPTLGTPNNKLFAFTVPKSHGDPH